MKNLLNRRAADWTLGDVLKTYGTLGILIMAIWKVCELIQEKRTDTIKMIIKEEREERNNTK